MNKSVRTAVAVFGALMVTLAIAPAAGAHDPIFVTADQTTPDTGPYMPDGSISWALYGSVVEPGDTRGFEFDLRDGDELVVSMLIPNLSPEVDLADDELPTMVLTTPDGSTIDVVPTTRDVFDEPFSKTSYVTLADVRQPGLAGRYTGLLTGNAPARFSVAIGVREIFFTDTERSGDRPSNFAEISQPLSVWYSTLPGEEPDLEDLEEGEAEIDLDMIEEAMESGEAEAPDGVLDGASQPPAETAIESPAEAAIEPVSEGDDGASTTWIAPVIVALIAALGAGVFFLRGRAAS